MRSTAVRGVRGAITVEVDEAQGIIAATKQLLGEIVRRNSIDADDITSVFFSVTRDLHSHFPACAARELGWDAVPMLDISQMEAQASLPRCIRVLLHVNTTRGQREIEHVYLEGATRLRPDLLHVR